MKKVVLATILLTFIITPFWGQQTLKPNEGYFTATGSYNWFVSGGLGMQLYYGNDDKEYMSMESVAFALDLAIGRWITPAIGLRGHLSGMQGNGWSFGESPYSYKEENVGLFKEKFFYANARMDLLWSMLDRGNKYKYSRPIRIIPFLGLGLATTFYPGVAGMELGISGTAGVIFNFNFVNNYSINLELRSTMLSGNMDKVVINSRGIEFMNAATIGVQYEISPKRYDRRSAVEQRYRNDIDALSRALARNQAENRQLNDRNLELNERCYQMIKDNELLLSASGLLIGEGGRVKPNKTAIIEMAIFFDSTSVVLSDMDKVNLKYLSETIKRNGGVFGVTPYTDNSIGEKSDNIKIAGKRGKSVIDYLIECGVKKDRLKLEVNEFNDVPFNTTTLNRCVIVRSEKLNSF